MHHEASATQDASIIHVNITDFFASLELAKDRSLNRKAFVIAPETYGACAIINTSEGARKEGIERGMSVAQAFRLVPNLTVLTPDMQQAQSAQRELLRIAQHYSPAIEHDMRGHLYLDAKGTRRLFGPPRDIAMDLSSHIREDLSITPSVGIASNRLVAKIATRAIRPSAVTAIAVGEERLFLRSQDIDILPGLTRSMKRVLAAAGMRNIGALADLDETQAVLLLGRNGINIRRLALGEDLSAEGIHTLENNQIETRVDLAHPSEHLPTIEGGMFQILEEAWTQLRAREEEAERVELTIIYADRQTSALSAAVPGQLLYDDQLISYGRDLLSRALKRRIMVSSIGIRLSRFHRLRKQHDLFQFEQEQLSERFQQHVDTLRRKYGNRIITRSFALYHG